MVGICWKTSFLLGWLPGRCYFSFREGTLLLKLSHTPFSQKRALFEVKWDFVTELPFGWGDMLVRSLGFKFFFPRTVPWIRMAMVHVLPASSVVIGRGGHRWMREGSSWLVSCK